MGLDSEPLVRRMNFWKKNCWKMKGNFIVSGERNELLKRRAIKTKINLKPLVKKIICLTR